MTSSDWTAKDISKYFYPAYFISKYLDIFKSVGIQWLDCQGHNKLFLLRIFQNISAKHISKYLDIFTSGGIQQLDCQGYFKRFLPSIFHFKISRHIYKWWHPATVLPRIVIKHPFYSKFVCVLYFCIHVFVYLCICDDSWATGHLSGGIIVGIVCAMGEGQQWPAHIINDGHYGHWFITRSWWKVKV